jgi:hypothetical protein
LVHPLRRARAELAAAAPFTSKDVDFQGSVIGAAECARLLDGTMKRPTVDDNHLLFGESVNRLLRMLLSSFPGGLERRVSHVYRGPLFGRQVIAAS